MHRPDTPGTIAGRYTDGQPYDDVSASIVGADLLNAVVDELAGVVEATGRTLDKADNGQVLASIEDLISQGARRRRQLRAQAQAGQTTLDTFGVGTLTVAGTPSVFDSAKGPHVKYTSGTSVGDECGLISPVLLQRRWDFDFELYVQLGVVTNSRMWFGLFESDPMGVVDPTSIECVGFRFDAATDQGGGGGDFKTVSSDGTSTTIKSTGVALAAATSYRLRVRHVGSGAFEFYVNDQLVNVHDGGASEFVPVGATPLLWVCKLRKTSDANPKDLRFSYAAALSE